MSILIPQYRTARKSRTAGLLLVDLVAHWDLGEASGTRNDSHTNALHLTDNNTVGSTTGVDGVSTCALFASASSEYLSRADNALFEPADEYFVVNFWAYRTGGAGAPHFVAKGNPGAAGGEWQIAALGASGAQNDVFGARLSDDYNRALINVASSSASTWYMYTALHDPSSNTIVMYRNGSSIGSAAITGGVYQGANKFTIGGISSNYLSGRIQCVSIWKGAGAATAITKLSWLYNSGLAARTYADLQAYGG